MPVITNSLSGVSAKLLDNTNVTLSFDASTSNQIVTLADKTYTNKVTIAKPNTLVPDNIKKGIEIAGITGTYGEGSTTLKALLDATKNAGGLFSGYSGSTVEGLIAAEDTSNVTTMANMFYGCNKLTTIPQLDTSNVTTMYQMFSNCLLITTIPQLDTSNVTTIQRMFYSCSNLVTIPQLNISKITNIYQMFAHCTHLSSIPLLDTSEVRDMDGTFLSCYLLTTIPAFNTSKVLSMQSTFNECSALTTIPALDVSNVTTFSHCFDRCTSLKSILMTGMAVSFDISASTQFETDDLVTILNNLATITTSQTLTMGATNLAKLSDEQKKIATDKGWTLA
nr:MAG TPA: protein of unknown function DUF285 [Caudoviricetes sp.]